MITYEYLYSYIFELFVSSFSILVSDMRNTLHSKSLNDINKYHMEGDVWTHTCCTYTYLQNIANDKLSFCDFITLALVILLHDSGKPYHVQMNKKGYRCFYNHEKESVRFIINNIDYIRRIITNINDIVYNNTNEIISNILLLVNAHNIYYNLKRDNKHDRIFGYLNYDKNLYMLFKYLIKADAWGQIKSINSGIGSKIDDFPQFKNKEKNKHSKKIVVVCGIPGSGKDTYIKKISQSNSIMLSFDDIRIEEYLKYNNVSDDIIDNKNELYKRAYQFCNDKNNKINISELLYNKIRNSFLIYDIVYISNTNLTTKTRKKFVNIFHKDYNLDCICILVPSYIAKARDKERILSDKSVGRDVIDNMFSNFILPTKAEGFDNIEYIYNF